MTRDEEIKKAAKEIAQGIEDWELAADIEDAFIEGAWWADAHPYWRSVDDEMPPRWETNPNVSVPVITCKFVNRELQDIDLQRYVFGESKWQYGDATHWMPFQFPEKGDEQ